MALKVKVKADVKVECSRVHGGFPEHAERLKLLKVGEIYRVDECLIMDAYTFIWLKEFPGVYFNSIHFEVLGYEHLYDGVFDGENRELAEKLGFYVKPKLSKLNWKQIMYLEEFGGVGRAKNFANKQGVWKKYLFTKEQEDIKEWKDNIEETKRSDSITAIAMLESALNKYPHSKELMLMYVELIKPFNFSENPTIKKNSIESLTV